MSIRRLGDTTPRIPDKEELKLLEDNFYLDENGNIFRMRKEHDREICTINRYGYKIIKINYLGKRREYRVHHIAWYFKYGSWPTSQIDHIDRNKLNNRVGNLRLANHTLNILNRYKIRDLPPGITTSKNGGYVPRITKNGVRLHLGTFSNLEDALDTYNKKYKEIYGEEFKP